MAWRARHRIAPAAILLLILIGSIGAAFFVLRPTDPQAAVVGVESLTDDKVACLQVFDLELGELEIFSVDGHDQEIGVMEIREVGNLLSTIQLWLNGNSIDLTIGKSVPVNDKTDIIYIGTQLNPDIQKKEATLCLIYS